ncbi:hypothetical protein M5K25_021274 [Dendrobium thyrsiflorum]|uniref:Uncharacterized protein n=1 Tax=Dendrobium thyrsiflorum TaxID=117978 RepID=A0ABD0UCN1_DENTH
MEPGFLQRHAAMAPAYSEGGIGRIPTFLSSGKKEGRKTSEAHWRIKTEQPKVGEGGLVLGEETVFREHYRFIVFSTANGVRFGRGDSDGRKSGVRQWPSESLASLEGRTEVGVTWRPGKNLESLGVQPKVQRHLEAGRKSNISWRLGGRLAVVENESGGKRALFLFCFDSFSSLLLFSNASISSRVEIWRQLVVREKSGRVRDRRLHELQVFWAVDHEIKGPDHVVLRTHSPTRSDPPFGLRFSLISTVDSEPRGSNGGPSPPTGDPSEKRKKRRRRREEKKERREETPSRPPPDFQVITPEFCPTSKTSRNSARLLNDARILSNSRVTPEFNPTPK